MGISSGAALRGTGAASQRTGPVIPGGPAR
jgi:hypothetical protein